MILWFYKSFKRDLYKWSLIICAFSECSAEFFNFFGLCALKMSGNFSCAKQKQLQYYLSQRRVLKIDLFIFGPLMYDGDKHCWKAQKAANSVLGQGWIGGTGLHPNYWRGNKREAEAWPADFFAELFLRWAECNNDPEGKNSVWTCNYKTVS